jgi:NADH-quinone oxidoreductase subunit A
MTSLFFLESTKIGLIILFSVALSCLIVLLSFLLGPSIPDSEKSSIYECGFDPYEDARNEFDVRFYLVAILFLIFDLEVSFLFPWVVSLGTLPLLGFWSMILFLVILTVGFIYEWRKGALDW